MQALKLNLPKFLAPAEFFAWREVCRACRGCTLSRLAEVLVLGNYGHNFLQRLKHFITTTGCPTTITLRQQQRRAILRLAPIINLAPLKKLVICRLQGPFGGKLVAPPSLRFLELDDLIGFLAVNSIPATVTHLETKLIPTSKSSLLLHLGHVECWTHYSANFFQDQWIQRVDAPHLRVFRLFSSAMSDLLDNPVLFATNDFDKTFEWHLSGGTTPSFDYLRYRAPAPSVKTVRLYFNFPEANPDLQDLRECLESFFVQMTELTIDWPEQKDALRRLRFRDGLKVII